MKKIICYITTCSKNYRRAKLCKQYLDRQNVEYYFVYGSPATTTVSPNLIFSDLRESYSQLAHKTYKIVTHFIHTGADILIKADDDTFIDFKNLPGEIFDKDYCGILNSISTRFENPKLWHSYRMKEYGNNEEYLKSPNVVNHDYINGGFYTLSRKAAEYIYNTSENVFINTPEKYMSEDKRVGSILTRHADIKIHSTGILRCTADRELLDLEISTNFSSIHPVHPLLFSKLENAVDRYAVLKKYDFLNAYNRINEYLQEV